MQSLSEKILLVWDTAALVMSWYAACLQKYHPPLFRLAPSPPLLKSANCPFLGHIPPPPLKKPDSSVKPHNIEIKSH